MKQAQTLDVLGAGIRIVAIVVVVGDEEDDVTFVAGIVDEFFRLVVTEILALDAAGE